MINTVSYQRSPSLGFTHPTGRPHLRLRILRLKRHQQLRKKPLHYIDFEAEIGYYNEQVMHRSLVVSDVLTINQATVAGTQQRPMGLKVGQTEAALTKDSNKEAKVGQARYAALSSEFVKMGR